MKCLTPLFFEKYTRPVYYNLTNGTSKLQGNASLSTLLLSFDLHSRQSGNGSRSLAAHQLRETSSSLSFRFLGTVATLGKLGYELGILRLQQLQLSSVIQKDDVDLIKLEYHKAVEFDKHRPTDCATVIGKKARIKLLKDHRLVDGDFIP